MERIAIYPPRDGSPQGYLLSKNRAFDNDDGTPLRLPLNPEMIERYLPLVRVVDTTYPPDRKIKTHLCPALTTVRDFPFGQNAKLASVLQTSEYITFTRMGPPEMVGPNITCTCPIPPYPKTIQRLVLNLTIDVSHYGLPRGLEFYHLPNDLKHMVLIFVSDPAPQFGTTVPRAGFNNQVGETMYLWPVNAAFQTNTRYTFVNFDIIPRDWFGFQPSDDPVASTAEIMLDRGAARLLRNETRTWTTSPPRPSTSFGAKEKALQHLKESVSFLSLDKYRAQVGDKQSRLETEM
ncbi:uncharacterized protein EHS24_001662 [Apiotrichum porosum]|uniref:Uncharacterized protein n=1 Tax=Apiotrichum porosum TaxID=105984 RepID=A0A427XIS9_9TREE|nr:uncharacterized protein EHS24_001662 [Apiotrichum porosum]RSH78756.1 hypothetical protein EHS24_001662 [Apiotrichum porosum]